LPAREKYNRDLDARGAEFGAKIIDKAEAEKDEAREFPDFDTGVRRCYHR